MASQLTCRFHRNSGDGSVDSICIACYATVASRRNKTELAPNENNHVCDPISLHYASQSCRSNHLLEESVLIRQFLPFPERTSRHTPAGRHPNEEQ
jgi:hypothetical protein